MTGTQSTGVQGEPEADNSRRRTEGRTKELRRGGDGFYSHFILGATEKCTPPKLFYKSLIPFTF